MTHESRQKTVGAGLVMGLVALGAYLLYASEGAGHRRRKLSSWALRAKADILDELDKASSLTRSTYNKIVDQVMEKYEEMKGIDAGDVAAAATVLKSYWNKLKGGIGTDIEDKKKELRRQLRELEEGGDAS